MQNKNILSLAGGFLIIISLFMPAITFMGEEISLFESASGVKYTFIIMAIIIIISAIKRIKVLNILSAIISVLIILLSMKYIGDAIDAGTKAGAGLWLLSSGGLICLAGSVKGLLTRNKKDKYVPEDFE